MQAEEMLHSLVEQCHAPPIESKYTSEHQILRILKIESKQNWFNIKCASYMYMYIYVYNILPSLLKDKYIYCMYIICGISNMYIPC